MAEKNKTNDNTENVYYDKSLLTEYDVHLFREGNYFRAYETLGAQYIKSDTISGTQFAVWAPNAQSVSVIGDFNDWNESTHQLKPRWDSSGIWEGFVPKAHLEDRYKYHIVSNHGNYSVDKGDPYARYWELSPQTASVIWELEYQWQDEKWMHNRKQNNSLNAPMSIYEIHLGSWRRVPEEQNRFLSYKELAHSLTEYILKTGFTHVELLPVMEHPFYGSWGYQTVGFFAPTSRYGTPQDFMYFIDYLHQHGIGVILDWVPSHFPSDEHGLIYFDGTHLYEHSDPRKGYHPDWNTYIFNYSRNEVKSFLISNALFWLEKYHIDGIRVDAVASMLYLDYSRKEGEWIPNEYGGRENIEAIDFLKLFNETVYSHYPDVQTIAEESTAWPMVSKPTYMGGLGFGMKWNMGWMHDTLDYMSKDPVHRRYHQGQLTFSMLYVFTENFILPLSHDEVVYGKGSILNKMPGDPWQKRASLRLLLGYFYTHPGKKLLFMGAEFGQWDEWFHDESLHWHLLDYPEHSALQLWIGDLNHLYRMSPALYIHDFSPEGFQWIDCSDYENSVLSFIRKGNSPEDAIITICNFTPVPRHNYRIGVPTKGFWQEILNSDAAAYGGSGQGNSGGAESVPVPYHGYNQSISLTLPPLGIIIFKHKRKSDDQ